MSATLLTYHVPAGLRAFSTTRVAPWPVTPSEREQMGAYAAFNVTHYCGDEPERVARCRRWLAEELKVTDERIIVPRQTHTANVRVLDEAWLKLSPVERAASLQEVDALVTNVPGLCIGISTADCVPVLLYDRSRRAVAAVHAGWRGTVKGITLRAVEVMCQTFGMASSDLHAIIGPSISAEAYEVGEEVAAHFVPPAFPPSVVVRRADWAKPHVDLWAANAFLLERAGLPLDHIEVAGVCTYTHSDTFYSARRLSIHSGRIYSGIFIEV